MAKDTEKAYIQEVARNKRASYEYEILDTLEVGIVLTGTEIKSLRKNGADISSAYISCDKQELWLINSSIAPYAFGNIYNHEEKRKRKLLAHHKEIVRLNAAILEKKLTCIPLKLYFKNSRAKLVIALARGKKLHDKRAAIKERDEKRTIDRLMKQ